MKSEPLKNILIQIANSLIEAVFPSICPVCESFFHMPESRYLHQTFRSVIPENAAPETLTFETIMRQYLCPGCLSEEFIPAEPPMCLKCGMILKEHKEKNSICARCQKFPPRFGIARSFGVYDHIFRECIHTFKYRGDIWLRKPFGILLFSAFVRNWHPKDIDIIIPVPLHIRKMRKRGFNQVYLMIKDWHRIAGILNTDISHIRIERQGLMRTRETETQVGMTREQRLKNLDNALSVPDPAKITGKRILLTDDVITTGATADLCARLLLENGAEQVDVLTLAQTVRRIPV